MDNVKLKLFVRSNIIVALCLIILTFISMIAEFILGYCFNHMFKADITLYAVIGLLCLLYIAQTNKAVSLNKFKRTKVPTKRKLKFTFLIVLPMIVFIILDVLFIYESYLSEGLIRAQYINSAVMYSFLTASTIAVIIGVNYSLKRIYPKGEVAKSA